MAEQPEFAEEASTAERIRLVLIWLAIGAAIVVPMELWFLPAFRHFSETAACRTIFGRNGLVVLLYGSLVALPLLFGLVVLATLGVRGYRVIKTERFPLAGEKVFRPTRIRRGARAKLFGWLHIGLVVPFFIVPVLGYRVAESFLPQGLTTPIACPPGDEPMTHRTPGVRAAPPTKRIVDDASR